ncbi:MAG: HAD family hydrolase [Planctomycetes bacterium]|nr:HAD family hydrolase [Planctomycetota bacterium]
MSYQSVLFDLDGTLLNTLDDIADAANCALRRLGFPQHRRESYKRYIGDGVEALIREVLPENRCDEATMAECAALLREEYGRRWELNTRPYEGVAELLDVLTARRIPMAILSNKPDAIAKVCVPQLLPRWDFVATLGEGALHAKKPDPAGALEIARRFGHAPADVVFVGDTGTDMKTATAAGMYAVGVLWGFRGADELLRHGAKVLIEKPADLLEIVVPGGP